MQKNKRDNIYIIIAAAVLIIVHLLVAVGFWVDPKGEIHNSVLIMYAEGLSFAAAVLGITFSARAAVGRIRQEALEIVRSARAQDAAIEDPEERDE
jgi:hypothetical protein